VKKKSLTKFIATSAFGIAMIIIAQLLSKVIPASQIPLIGVSTSQIITGSLVNCVLFVFSEIYGMYCGMTIGVCSAIIASLIGVGPSIIVIVPIIACGNALLCLLYCCLKKLSHILRIIIAAAGKCAFLWIGVSVALSLLSLKAAQVSTLTLMFSWPQGITALVGGLLASLISKRICPQLKQ
jgi:hypothetical protein